VELPIEVLLVQLPGEVLLVQLPVVHRPETEEIAAAKNPLCF
jgi:hypothetical protein